MDRMKIFFYNGTIKGSRPHKPLPQRELMRARRNYHEKLHFPPFVPEAVSYTHLTLPTIYSV